MPEIKVSRKGLSSDRPHLKVLIRMLVFYFVFQLSPIYHTLQEEKQRYVLETQVLFYIQI